jgi:hypothetical protein
MWLILSKLWRDSTQAAKRENKFLCPVFMAGSREGTRPESKILSPKSLFVNRKS